jgi:hypothetical protein
VCGNHTLRLEINLVRFEVTLVGVVIPFMPVEITLRIQITPIDPPPLPFPWTRAYLRESKERSQFVVY